MLNSFATWHMERRGSGAPLLWGHGLLGSMALENVGGFFQWDAVGEQCELIRYDARGHGNCSANADDDNPQEDPPYRWTSMAADMLQIATHCAVDSFIAGGQSMGAATALYASLAAPQRVRGLILATPPVGWEARRRRAQLYAELIPVIEKRGSRLLALMMKQQTLLPPWLIATAPDYQAAAIELVANTPATTLVDIYRGAALSDYPAPHKLARVTQPCLILAWEDDPAHPLETARALSKHLPNARLEVAASAADVARWPTLMTEFIAAQTPR